MSDKSTTKLHTLSDIFLHYQANWRIILHSNLWDTGDPKKVALQSPIACFLYTLEIVFQLFHLKTYIKRICMKKSLKQKGFLRKFVINA